ncbi:MAG TPA: hypothetical protein VNM16_03615 [Bacillota bacterium]|nr:hypothetical protein [Bacillota bacterium]
MAKGRGVVLELSGQQAVVLDETGLFRRVPAAGQGWQVGDEVWLDVGGRAAASSAGGRRQAWWHSRGFAVAAACVVLLAIAVPFGYQAEVNAQTVAVVTFDVNPSVELDLNSSAQVLRALPLDADGRTLLGHVRLGGAPLGVAIADLTSAAAAEGFISKTETVPVVIAGAPSQGTALPPAVATALQATQQRTAATLSQQGYHVSVAAVSAPQGDQRAARAVGLSLGRYLIYQQAKAAGVSIKPAALRGAAIVTVLRKAGASDAQVQQVLQGVAQVDGAGGQRGGGSQAATSTTTVERGGRGSGQGNGQGNGQGQDQGSGKDSGQGAGNGSAQGSGDGSGRGSGKGSGQGLGDASGNGSGNGLGDGSGKGSAPGQGPGFGLGLGQASGPGVGQGQNAGPGASQGQGAPGRTDDQGSQNDGSQGGTGRTDTRPPTGSISGGQGTSDRGTAGRAPSQVATGTATATVSPGSPDSRGGGRQGASGWPEQILKDLQGLFHGRRQSEQGGDGRGGQARATATATTSRSASPGSDQGGGQGRGQGGGH